ncbi:hypothetical protein [Oceanivirga miroungae]|uniref:Uncharacterized protein n=1 Tax=Oceanivirga miroungae TaxID=1130046 RepID=A0A6I8MCX5_9FUSO|nr:hypothetical protein [Oceanivirga miroungae]VWL85342.1 hypothetical protein OMES3154_00627 [Oceanivirga miroungae]
MDRLKKLTILSSIWNLVIFLLLFFQSSIIFEIVRENLFPSLKFIKPLFDDKIISFIKSQIILTIITIVIMILVEIVLFFVINTILQKKYNKYINFKYYKYLNIYFIISILILLFTIGYYSINILNHYNGIYFNMNNKTLNSIIEILKNTEFTNMVNVETFINLSIEKIKNDSEIYKFVIEVLNFIDAIYYIKLIFYKLSYILLVFGIYKNIRIYLSIDEKGM